MKGEGEKEEVEEREDLLLYPARSSLESVITINCSAPRCVAEMANSETRDVVEEGALQIHLCMTPQPRILATQQCTLLSAMLDL